MTSRTPRRRTAALAGLVLAGLTLSACAGTSDVAEGDAPETGGQLVWADFGGSTNTSWNEVFFDDFTAETGIEVISTSISGTIQYDMLDGEEGDYDAMMTGIAEIELYNENLLTLPDGTNRNDLLNDNLQDYAMGSMFVGYAQAYLTETFPDGGPTSWADFWDVETYPGMRAVPGEYHDYMFEAALLADGVAPEDLYPIDLDRAVAKLDELRPHLTFYTEYPQIQQLLTSGSVALAFGPNGQFAGLSNQGVDMTVVWDEAFVEANLFVIPLKAPNADNAFLLADFLGDPERQAEFAGRTNYGPGNAEAFDFMDDELKDRLPNSPSNTATVLADPAGRAEAYEASVTRYTDWLAG